MGAILATRTPTPASPLPLGVTLRAIDGERMISATTMSHDYYSSHGFTNAVGKGWDDPDYFSIAVWSGPINDTSDTSRLADLAINTMAAIGPSFMDASTFSRLAASGVSFIAETDEQAEVLLSSSAAYWVGNITQDEATTFAAGVSNYLSTLANARQDGRWWWYNGNWFFFNPLSHPEQPGGLDPYEAAVALSTTVATPNATTRHIDHASTDLYWLAGGKASTGFVLGAGQDLYGLASDMTSDEAARACHYGDMVDFMRVVQSSHFPAPIGNFIENGGPYFEDTTAATYISPAELNAAMWSSIIHGARWLVYFNHTFAGPAAVPDISVDNFGLAYFQTIQSGESISIYNQAKATNQLIASLAVVINSPFALGYVTVSPPGVVISSSAADSGFDVMAKWYNNKFYIFAMPRYSRSTTNQTATFTIKNTGTSQVTVINESRTISVTAGTTFTDTFATGSTVHIYRVD